MESKKINQLATELTPVLSDLTIIGDPTTGISKKITLSQMASLFTGTVEEYPNLAAFPLVGTADTIYIALDTNVLYRWDTGLTSYVELSPNIINSLVFNDANGFDGTIALVGSVATLTITTALTTGSVGFIGASGALLQDNANFFWDDTNNRLGIGTNAPTTAIDVFGSGIIGRLNGTSTNNSFLGFASAGSNKWSIGNVQSDHRFRIYNEATTSELVSVLSTGEFGIGISNPTTKFHIDGGASALIANLDANVSVAKSISFRSDNSNRINLEVSGTESGSNAGANLFIRRYSDAGALIDTPLTITRSTGSVTLANDLIVDTNTLYVDSTNNRVGIGTISPINLFHAAGTGRIDTGLYFNNSVTNGAFVWQIANEALRFGTNDTERMRITSGGNVGIGVSAPTQNTFGINRILEIGGASVPGIVLRTASGTFGEKSILTGGDGLILAATGSSNASVDNIIRFFTGATNSSYGADERMRITSSGNVFIGTTSSVLSGRMEFLIGGNANGSVIGLGNNGNANKVQIVTDSGENMLLVNRSNTPMILYTNDTERMRIANNGFVGIGTSNPLDKFVVTGNSNIWTGNFVGTNTTNSSFGLQVLAGSSGNDTSFRCVNGAQALELFKVRGDGAIFFQGNYPFTTGSGANLWIDSSGVIQRNVSSLKYKKDVQDYDKGLADLMKLRTVSYLSKSEIDNPKRYAGMIAEELHELGFNEYVNLDSNGEPDSISYANMVTLLIKSVQELKLEIDILKNK